MPIKIVRKIFISLFFLFATFSFVRADQFPANRHLKNLLDSGEYFQFRDEFEKEHKYDVHYSFEYPGHDSNALNSSPNEIASYSESDYFFTWENFLFNKPIESNKGVETILNNKRFACPDSIVAELLELHFQNDLRLFHYKSADSICNILLSRYSSMLNKKTLDGIKNSQDVITALKDVPPQTMERNGDLDVKFKRDISNLIHIPVSMNGENGNFIMDTGANLSTLSESEAKKMGVKILNANFGVTSSSRASVESKLGVADKVQIGNVTFRNVVFIILPDKSLSFVGGLYKIKGIIGLPVIAQLGEVQINTKTNHVFSPVKQTESDLHNFGLNGNTPFANVNFFGTYHPYIFDTGAATCILGNKFHSIYNDSLKTYKQGSSHVGGAGGVQKISILRITHLHYAFGSQNGMLKIATLQLSGNSEAWDDYYGIVGEDIFSQWSTVTINFDKMFVLMK